MRLSGGDDQVIKMYQRNLSQSGEGRNRNPAYKSASLGKRRKYDQNQKQKKMER